MRHEDAQKARELKQVATSPVEDVKKDVAYNSARFDVHTLPLGRTRAFCDVAAYTGEKEWGVNVEMGLGNLCEDNSFRWFMKPYDGLTTKKGGASDV